MWHAPQVVSLPYLVIWHLFFVKLGKFNVIPGSGGQGGSVSRAVFVITFNLECLWVNVSTINFSNIELFSYLAWASKRLFTSENG